MCLLAYLPKGTTLERYEVMRAFSGNPDGVGVAWWEDGEWKMVKGIMSIGRTLEVLEKLEDTDKVVHFRLGVVGPRHPKLTHPFLTDRKMLFQNGVWSGYRELEEKIKRGKIPRKHWVEFNKINQTPRDLTSDTKLMAFLLYLNDTTNGKYQEEVEEMLQSAGRIIILEKHNPNPTFISHFYTDGLGRRFSNPFFTNYADSCI